MDEKALRGSSGIAAVRACAQRGRDCVAADPRPCRTAYSESELDARPSGAELLRFQGAGAHRRRHGSASSTVDRRMKSKRRGECTMKRHRGGIRAIGKCMLHPNVRSNAGAMRRSPVTGTPHTSLKCDPAAAVPRTASRGGFLRGVGGGGSLPPPGGCFGWGMGAELYRALARPYRDKVQAFTACPRRRLIARNLQGRRRSDTSSWARTGCIATHRDRISPGLLFRLQKATRRSNCWRAGCPWWSWRRDVPDTGGKGTPGAAASASACGAAARKRRHGRDHGRPLPRRHGIHGEGLFGGLRRWGDRGS